MPKCRNTGCENQTAEDHHDYCQACLLGCLPQELPATGSRYFIATRKHGFVGNDVLFWRPEAKGYTTNLDDAGKYSEAEATKIVRGAPPGECRMLPVDDVIRLTRRVFDGQDMHPHFGGWDA